MPELILLAAAIALGIAAYRTRDNRPGDDNLERASTPPHVFASRATLTLLAEMEARRGY